MSSGQVTPKDGMHKINYMPDSMPSSSRMLDDEDFSDASSSAFVENEPPKINKQYF